MTREGALDVIRDCLQTVLQLTANEARAVSAATTPLDLPGWTSLAHVQLVLELERSCDVTFDADEIAALASVTAMLDALERRRVR